MIAGTFHPLVLVRCLFDALLGEPQDDQDDRGESAPRRIVVERGSRTVEVTVKPHRETR